MSLRIYLPWYSKERMANEACTVDRSQPIGIPRTTMFSWLKKNIHVPQNARRPLRSTAEFKGGHVCLFSDRRAVPRCRPGHSPISPSKPFLGAQYTKVTGSLQAQCFTRFCAADRHLSRAGSIRKCTKPEQMLFHSCPLTSCLPWAPSRPQTPPQTPPRPERRSTLVTSGPAMKPVEPVTSTTTLPSTAPVSTTPAQTSPPLPGARGYRVSTWGGLLCK